MDMQKIIPYAQKLYSTLLNSFITPDGFMDELAVNYSAGLAGYAARQGAKEMAEAFPVAGPNTDMRDDHFLSLFFNEAGYCVMNHMEEFFKRNGDGMQKPDAEEIIKRVSENVNNDDFKLYNGSTPAELNDNMKCIWDGLYRHICAELESGAERSAVYNSVMIPILEKAAETMPADEVYRKALESAAAMVYLKGADDDFSMYPEEIRHLIKTSNEMVHFFRSVLTDKKEALIAAAGLAGHACYMAAKEMGDEFNDVECCGDKVAHLSSVALELLGEKKYNVLVFALLFMKDRSDKETEDIIQSIKDGMAAFNTKHLNEENYKICGEYEPDKVYALVEHFWDMYFEGGCKKICKSPEEWPKLYSLPMQLLMKDALEDMTAEEVLDVVLDSAVFFAKADKDTV